MGNAILSKARLSGYTTNAHAAAIGASGGGVARLIMAKSAHDRSSTRSRFAPLLELLDIVITYTRSAVLGWAILRFWHVDLGGIDLAHSASAGALGGIIIIIILLTILAWHSVFEWIYARLNYIREKKAERDSTNAHTALGSQDGTKKSVQYTEQGNIKH